VLHASAITDDFDGCLPTAKGCRSRINSCTNTCTPFLHTWGWIESLFRHQHCQAGKDSSSILQERPSTTCTTLLSAPTMPAARPAAMTAALPTQLQTAVLHIVRCHVFVLVLWYRAATVLLERCPELSVCNYSWLVDVLAAMPCRLVVCL